MTNQILAYGSRDYWILLALLAFARGMDLLSTRIGTPNLLIEGNPIARWLGFRGGVIVNVIFCVAVPVWPMPTIIVTVMTLLVAAHNFQNVWLMRSMGETEYAIWLHERIANCPRSLFVSCIGAQSLLTGLAGAALLLTSGENSIPFAVGVGIIGYALAVFVFTTLSMWRIRRA